MPTRAQKPFQLQNLVQSTGWFWAFVVTLTLCLTTFVVQSLLYEIHPGNLWGLTYGTLATVLMLGAALFGLRRRLTRFTKKFSAGRAQTWVQFHVYAGTLFLVLMLMHTGFSWPRGQLTWWLFTLSIWVSLSGLLGVFLQKWIPKILTSGLSIEALYERIPELIAEIREKSERLLQLCEEPVQDYYAKNIGPALAAPQVRLIYYIDITGGIQSQIKQFSYLGKILSPEGKARLNLLQSYYRTKLELDAHYTLQKGLRWWLYLHVPLSLGLVLLVGLHVYSIIYF